MSYDRPISHSGMKTYQKCPKLWEAIYIFGQKTPTSPAAKRGNDIHDALDKYFSAKVEPASILWNLHPWRSFLRVLRSMNPVPEGEVAVDTNWEPIPYGHISAYFRGKIDLSYFSDGLRCILDWKSGRQYPDHREQGESYVALSPPADAYQTAFVYIDDPLTIVSYEYTPEQRLEIIAKRRDQIETIRNATEFQPTPSDSACKWCPLNWRNGGACHAAP